MENFIVSARKYRPATFATVVGQSAITNTLKNAIKNQQIAQAFLFTGPRGVGKTTCARILAKTINCSAITAEGEACDTCQSCLSFNKSASFNIFELDAASNNTVDDIRNLVDQVRIPPQQGYKVYIVDEVHMLSQSAFNAFLKTLEEPPPYAKFILATTEKHKILPTILSRCQIFDFRRISVDDIAHHLHYVAESERIEAEPEALHIIAQKADGGLRDALSMFDQLVSFSGNNLTYKQVIENLNVLDYEYYFKITNFILASNISNTLLTINEIIENGFEGQHFITGLGQHLRNLLVSKDKITLELLETSKSVKDEYFKQASKCSVSFLLNALEITNESDINYKTSNNKKLHVEIALMKLCKLSFPATDPFINNTIEIAGNTGSISNVLPHNSGVTSNEVSNNYSDSSQSNKQNNTDASHTYKQITQTPIIDNQESAKPSYQTPTDSISEFNEQSSSIVTENVHESFSINSNSTMPDKGQSKPIQYNAEGSSLEIDKVSDPKSAVKSSPSLSGLSLGNLMSGNPKKEEIVEEEENLPGEFYGNEQFTISEVLTIWPLMVYQLAAEFPLLHSTLLWKAPDLIENNVINISIENPIQQDEVSKNKNEITLYLRKHLKNDYVSIATILIESTSESRRPYTDNEKYDFIAERAPNIRIMKDQLGLELDM